MTYPNCPTMTHSATAGAWKSTAMRGVGCTGAIAGAAGDTSQPYRVGRLKTCPTKGSKPIMSTQNETDKPNGGRKKSERPTLSPEMALEILRTSLNYVKGSGLPVKIGNRGGLCVIAIGGAVWDDDTHALCVITNHDDTQADDTQAGLIQNSSERITSDVNQNCHR